MRTLLALFLVAALAGCGSGDATPSDDAAPEAPADSTSEPSGDTDAGGESAVSIAEFAFNPAEITVPAGDEVTWTNAPDEPAHTVKFEDEESDRLEGGDTYSRSFDEAGQYDYVCGIHPQMTGSVTVE